MKRISRSLQIMGLICLFFVSFMFFLYFTFPYGVLKEAITSSINKSSDINIRIGELGPRFPLGLEAENILIFTDKGRKDLTVHSVGVSLTLWRLLIGQVYTDIEMRSKNGGELELGVKIGLLNLLFGSEYSPGFLVDAENFAIDGVLDFGLSSLSDSQDVSPLLQPLLNQIRLTGNLNGTANIYLDMADPKSSSGNMDLSMAGGQLMIDDPALNISPQNFSKFVVKAKMDQGALVIDTISGLASQELKIDLNGRVGFNRILAASELNINLAVELEEQLKETFALVIELAMGGKDGKGRIQVAGTLGNPYINKM